MRWLGTLGAVVLATAGLALLATWLVGGAGESAAVGPRAASAAPGPSGAQPPAVLEAPTATVRDEDAAREPEPAAVESRAPEPEPRAMAPERVATRATIAGIVRDVESGAGVPDVTLALLAGAERLASALTDSEGRFALGAPADIPLTIVLEPSEGWLAREPRAELGGRAAGERVELELRLEPWPPPVAGDLAGRLVTESGPWTRESAPASATLLLDLVSVGEPRIERRGVLELVASQDEEVELVFRFADVPRGEYELVLSSLDAHAWEPRSIFVSPPAEGLVFTRLDGSRAPPLAFRVLDAATLEPLEEHEARLIRVTTSLDNGTLLHTGPLDLQAFPDGARFEWSIQADGYAPAFGDERAFHIEGTGAEARRVAEVRLERGWGTRFLALGGLGTKEPLAGVSLLLDGELAGTTDPAGWLEVRRAERPGKVEARYLDWKLTHDPLAPWGGRSAERRGGVTPVLLEP